MKIHLIAIGGSAMHNLAIALKQKRNKVTGSDDKIFSPSKERLEKQNLLPEKTGWDPSKITKDIDIVIVGMHAKEDNPELLKAIELNLKIFHILNIFTSIVKTKNELLLEEVMEKHLLQQ
jgi:UDP-N-acetylmuramate: L-alanyl-gamma-D-glutamyl-meso-diaminopimelate ligase